MVRVMLKWNYTVVHIQKCITLVINMWFDILQLITHSEYNNIQFTVCAVIYATLLSDLSGGMQN